MCRDLGERLTEAVGKEIELKTPFKVVGSPDADSILSVRLISDTKRVTIENPNDDPRAIEVNMLAEVTWLNRRREPLRLPSALILPPELLPFNQTASLLPEAGLSVDDGPTTGDRTARAADRLDDGRAMVRAIGAC